MQIKLNKKVIGDEFSYSDKFLSNARWAIKKERVDFGNIITSKEIAEAIIKNKKVNIEQLSDYHSESIFKFLESDTLIPLEATNIVIKDNVDIAVYKNNQTKRLVFINHSYDEWIKPFTDNYGLYAVSDKKDCPLIIPDCAVIMPIHSEDLIEAIFRPIVEYM